MVYVAGHMDAAIAAAAGNDPELLRELRGSFARSLTAQIDLLSRARCDGNWCTAARRLHGLGVSFHDKELAQLAEAALAGAPGDPVILRQIVHYAGKFAAES